MGENTLDPNKLVIQSNTFQGGLVTLMPPHLLDDGASPSCQNVDFSRSYGRLTKRRGSSKYIDATGKNGATGLYEFINAVPTTYLYEVIDSVIYEVTAPSTLTERWVNGAPVKQVAQVEWTSDTNPFKVSIVAHGYSTGNVLRFWGQFSDAFSLAGNTYTITVTSVDQFTLDGTAHVGAITDRTFPQSGYVTKASTIVSMGETNFTTFDALCIAVAPGSSTLKATGVQATDGKNFDYLLGTPPANAAYIETHKGKVFIANHGGGHSRLSWSVTDDPEDWTTITGAATDAGFNDVGLDDGDVITGIKSLGSVLVIFKRTSIWVMSGNDTTDFKFRKISPSLGCIAPRSIVGCDSFAIFLSQLGVYSINSDGPVMLSYNIKPTIEGWSDTIKRAAVAGRLNTQYWLAVNEDGASSTNEVVYYLDYVLGVWGKYTVPNPAVFVTRQDATLISAAATVGHITLHDTGTEDAAGVVDMVWDTPDYDFGDWVKVKHPLDAVICAKAISAKNITVSHLVDGATIGTTLTFLLTASGSKDKAFFLKRSFPSTSYGRYLRFRFRNNETAAAVEVFAYSIRANIDERQQG